MRTGWRNKTRRDKLEHIAWKGDSLTLQQYGVAWQYLMHDLCVLSDPMGRPPRFDDLIAALVRAQMKAKRS